VRQLANASRVVTLARSYDPFGNLLTGTPTATVFGYAGEQRDGMGLIFLRARFYDPVTGRFITRDPFPGILTNPQTLNPYVYVEGNPINWTDPTGQYAWNNTGSLNHTDIEQYLERMYGMWNIHTEYKVGPGRKGTRFIDIVFFSNVSDYYSAFNPGLIQGQVYEVEPYYGPQWVQLAQSEIRDEKLPALRSKQASLKGKTTGYLPGESYDWTRVQWLVGVDPIPGQPVLIPKSGGNGMLLVWYENLGAIMFIDSTWDDSRLRKTPPIMFDWLEAHKKDSLENQQFAELVEQAKYGIPVDNWPGVSVPSEEQARVAGEIAFVTAAAGACYLLIKLAPLLLLVP